MSDPLPPSPLSGRARAAVFAVAVVVLVCAVSALVVLTEDDGDTYYVSAYGDDMNDGSESEPFLTLERALQAAGDGDTVVLLSDMHIEDDDLLIDASVTLDLGGRTVYFAEPSIWVWPTDGGSVDVTIENGTLVRETYGEWGLIYVGDWQDGGRTSLTLSDVEIRCAGTAVCVYGSTDPSGESTTLKMLDCDVAVSDGCCVYTDYWSFTMSLEVRGGSYASGGDVAFFLMGQADAVFADFGVTGVSGFDIECDGDVVLDGVGITVSGGAGEPLSGALGLSVGVGIYDYGGYGYGDSRVTLRGVTVAADGAELFADVYFGYVGDPDGYDEAVGIVPGNLRSSVAVLGADGGLIFEVTGSSASSANHLLIGLGDQVTVEGQLSGCATVNGNVTVVGDGLVLAQTDGDMVLTIAESGVFDVGAGVTVEAQNVVVEGTVVLAGERSEAPFGPTGEYWVGGEGPYDASELQDVAFGEVTYAADTATWSGYVAWIEVTGTLYYTEEVPPQFEDEIPDASGGYWLILDIVAPDATADPLLACPWENDDGEIEWETYEVEGVFVWNITPEDFADGVCEFLDMMVYDADGDGSEYLPTLCLLHFVLEAARAA